MQEKHDKTHLIGDALEIKGIKNAILQGEMLGYTLRHTINNICRG